MTTRWLLIATALTAAACSSDSTPTSTGPTGTTSAAGGSTSSSGGQASSTGQGGATGGSTSSVGGTGGTSSVGGQGGGSAGSGGGGAAGSGGGGAAGSGGGGGSSVACTWQNGVNPCGAGFYCKAPGCGQGFCEAVTAVDDTTKVAVCGCDGVNYWNAITASNHGMSVASSGPCSQPAFCGGFGNLQCPQAQHYCAKEVMTSLGCNISDAGGACWGMPITCNTVGFGGNRRPCFPPNAGCLYECEAIKSESTYWGPDNTCPM